MHQPSPAGRRAPLLRLICIYGKKGNRIGMESAAGNAGEACRRLARQHDFERYLATLFAPRRQRPALWILLAFNAEIARTREIVSEPAIGSIRLQWWREVLEAAAAGGPVRAHEVAAPLTAALRDGRLDAAQLEALIDGRERDLDDAPMADETALRDYAGRTGGTLAEAMALAAAGGRTSDATRLSARALGTGWALTGILRAAGFHAARGRQLLPQSALAAAGAGPAGSVGRARGAGGPGGGGGRGGDGAQSARRRGQNRRTGGSIAGVETGRDGLAGSAGAHRLRPFRRAGPPAPCASSNAHAGRALVRARIVGRSPARQPRARAARAAPSKAVCMPRLMLLEPVNVMPPSTGRLPPVM